MADAEKLEPPKGVPVEDPGAHELGMNGYLSLR
jgi:hypothetical protein